MFRFIALISLVLLCNHPVAQGTDAVVTITASLLEEVMALKDQIHALELEVQELQCTSTCDDSVTSGGSSNGTAFGQLRYDGVDTFAGESWSTVIWDGLDHSKNLIYNNVTGTVTFPFTGTYQFTISLAEATAYVEWTLFRIYGITNGNTVGISSQFALSEETSTNTDVGISFLATIDDIGESYTIQIGYNDASSSLTLDNSPAVIDGMSGHIMLCIINYLG